MLESVLDGPEPLDAEHAFTLDLRFHRALAWCTHNPLIVGFTGATAIALRRFPRSPELAPQEIVAELDAVAHAVGSRDGGAAAQAMRRHLRRSADFFRSASLIAADG
jgi:DNA-binding FadR family transcriptional regulator